MRHSIISALFVATLAALLLMLAPPACSGSGQKEVSIRLKWLHQAQFAGFYWAREAGLYRDAGVVVDLLPGGVDYPAVQMVATGSDDFGVTGADQILLARAKGIPVVAVACIYQRTPFVLFSDRKKGIESVKDLIGKRVGVKFGGNEEMTYRAMLANSGVRKDQVTEVPVKYDMTPLLTGNVDVWPGYSINEPQVARRHGLDVVEIPAHAAGLDLYADVLFCSEKTIRERPGLVHKIVAATLEGWKRAFQERETAVGYVMRFALQTTAEHQRFMLDASRDLVMPNTDLPVGWMTTRDWRQVADVLQQSGHRVTQEIETCFRLDFIPPK